MINFRLLLLVVSICFGFVAETTIEAQNRQPILENVSIDENGDVIISWAMPDGAPDVDGFLIEMWIYRDAGGDTGFQPLEIIMDGDLRQYVHTPNNACDERNIYTVRSILDGVNSLPSAEMQTIYLSDIIDYQVCARTSTIEWTAFTTNDDDDGRYRIYVQEDGSGSYELVADLSREELTLVGDESTYENPSPSRTNIYAYNHSGLNPGSTYRYYVAAVYGVGQESHSCRREITAETYPMPAFYNLLAVSVTPDNEVELTLELDITVQLENVLVFRSDLSPQAVTALGEYPIPSSSSTTLTDATALADQTAYYYQFGVNDQCTYELRDPNIHRTMLLSVEINDSDQAGLSWNQYEGWPVDQYEIYRKLPGEDTFEMIDVIPGTIFEYTEDLTLLSDQEKGGSIAYFVRAIESDNGLIPPAQLSSNSNVTRVSFEEDPGFGDVNAFNPLSLNSVNAVFKPTTTYFGPERYYLLQIYNRWGELIFESREFNHGWDGTFKGELVPKGVYIYSLNYTSLEGFDVNKRGTVMVIY